MLEALILSIFVRKCVTIAYDRGHSKLVWGSAALAAWFSTEFVGLVIAQLVGLPTLAAYAVAFALAFLALYQVYRHVQTLEDRFATE